MSGHTVTIKGPAGDFEGYLALPAGRVAKAGVVVIQEIFGVNDVMRALTDSYAAQGYAALCPDLFWRIEPGVALTDRTEAEWKRAFELYQAFDVDDGVEDIDAAIEHLRAVVTEAAAAPGAGPAAEIESGAKVGAVGFCLGGLLAYLTAARTAADASVGYYGVAIEQRLEEAEKLARPLLLHIAEKDQFVPPDAQEKIKAGLAHHPEITLHTYEGQDHAFARVGGQHYDEAAAKLANERTLAFLQQNLLG